MISSKRGRDQEEINLSLENRVKEFRLKAMNNRMQKNLELGRIIRLKIGIRGLIKSLEVNPEVSMITRRMIETHSNHLNGNKVKQDNIVKEVKLVKDMAIERVNQVPKDQRDITLIDKTVIMMVREEKNIIPNDLKEAVIDIIEMTDLIDLIDLKSLIDHLTEVIDMKGQKEQKGTKEKETKDRIDLKELREVKDLKEVKNLKGLKDMRVVKDLNKEMNNSVKDIHLKKGRILRVKSNNIIPEIDIQN